MIYLSLGSNLGDREANLRGAVQRLQPRRVSPVYETSPVDFPDQPFFLNQVVETETDLTPLQYLSRTQEIERDLGRVRTTPKGPRIIDIDILMFDTIVIQTARLEIPHPRLHQRRFVLIPLADLDPSLRHPVTLRTVTEMLNSLRDVDLVQPWKSPPK